MVLIRSVISRQVIELIESGVWTKSGRAFPVGIRWASTDPIGRKLSGLGGVIRFPLVDDSRPVRKK
jgi:hypothetical protein